MSRKFQKNISAKKLQSRRGFSMLEMLIAGFILSVGLIGTLQLVAKSMSNSTDARNHVIASSLAQEGLELVRNIRDNSTSLVTEPPGSFFNFPNENVETVDNCKVQKSSTSILSSECGANDKKLYIDGNGFYVHTVSANTTKFQRKIRLQYQDSTGSETSSDNNTPGVGDDDAYQVNIRVAVTWATNFPTDSYNDLDADPANDCNLQSKCVMLESTLTKRH